MPIGRPRRLDAFSYVGRHRYHFRLGTWDRVPHFASGRIVDEVREQFLVCFTRPDVAILAYCFMPDHVHVLVEGLTSDARPVDLIVRWKQASGFWFQREHHERLWQPSFFERVLREGETSCNVARYILANPVRGGIVTSPSEYPFSFCAWQEDWSELRDELQG